MHLGRFDVCTRRVVYLNHMIVRAQSVCKTVWQKLRRTYPAKRPARALLWEDKCLSIFITLRLVLSPPLDR